MKKGIPLKSYFNRAKVFGYVLILILVSIIAYLTYTSIVGS